MATLFSAGVRARVQYLCRHYFADNVAVMARALEINTRSLTRIIRDDAAVSLEIAATIAARLNVSAAWLLTGVGAVCHEDPYLEHIAASGFAGLEPSVSRRLRPAFSVEPPVLHGRLGGSTAPVDDFAAAAALLYQRAVSGSDFLLYSGCAGLDAVQAAVASGVFSRRVAGVALTATALLAGYETNNPADVLAAFRVGVTSSLSMADTVAEFFSPSPASAVAAIRAHGIPLYTHYLVGELPHVFYSGPLSSVSNAVVGDLAHGDIATVLALFLRAPPTVFVFSDYWRAAELLVPVFNTAQLADAVVFVFGNAEAAAAADLFSQRAAVTAYPFSVPVTSFNEQLASYHPELFGDRHD